MYYYVQVYFSKDYLDKEKITVLVRFVVPFCCSGALIVLLDDDDDDNNDDDDDDERMREKED